MFSFVDHVRTRRHQKSYRQELGKNLLVTLLSYYMLVVLRSFRDLVLSETFEVPPLLVLSLSIHVLAMYALTLDPYHDHYIFVLGHHFHRQGHLKIPLSVMLHKNILHDVSLHILIRVMGFSVFAAVAGGGGAGGAAAGAVCHHCYWHPSLLVNYYEILDRHMDHQHLLAHQKTVPRTVGAGGGNAVGAAAGNAGAGAGAADVAAGGGGPRRSIARQRHHKTAAPLRNILLLLPPPPPLPPPLPPAVVSL